ncbi:hypothetical protein JHK87_006777 [Glycine soja]|nr:hypothetical protein JHK87_006777 [Glycine soja]
MSTFRTIAESMSRQETVGCNGGGREKAGGNDLFGIVDYLKKQSGPASTEIKFADEPTAFVGENKVAIVSWSFSLEDFDNFSALAEKLRSDYDFGHPLNVKLLPRGES